jgi:hypothetical protein
MGGWRGIRRVLVWDGTLDVAEGGSSMADFWLEKAQIHIAAAIRNRREWTGVEHRASAHRPE